MTGITNCGGGRFPGHALLLTVRPDEIAVERLRGRRSMFWRCFCMIACLAFISDGASAQQRAMRVRGPEGVMLTIGPIGPAATEEGIVAQLSEALANFDNTSINVREGLVRQGEELAGRLLPYEAVARLANDVNRMGGARVLSAGAPIYRHDFANGDALLFNGSTPVRRLWCGAAAAGGYCLMRRGDDWEAAPIHSYAPYAPMTYGRFVPVNAPEIRSDDTALTELPVRREVYRLTRMHGATATIARALHIGDDAIEVDELHVSELQLGSLRIEIEPGPEANTAMVRSAALNPDDYGQELRSIARSVLEARR